MPKSNYWRKKVPRSAESVDSGPTAYESSHERVRGDGKLDADAYRITHSYSRNTQPLKTNRSNPNVTGKMHSMVSGERPGAGGGHRKEVSPTSPEVSIKESIWQLHKNPEFCAFKIHAPGSKDAVRILSSASADSRTAVEEAGGTSNFWVIIPDIVRWAKLNGRKGSKKANVTSCVIFSSILDAYKTNPLLEERRLRECLLEVESRNDVFRFGNAIKAQWRLAQSCLEYQPNVCVALVGTASALEEAILCKESSDATDLGFLVPVVLTALSRELLEHSLLRNRRLSRRS